MVRQAAGVALPAVGQLSGVAWESPRSDNIPPSTGSDADVANCSNHCSHLWLATPSTRSRDVTPNLTTARHDTLRRRLHEETVSVILNMSYHTQTRTKSVGLFYTHLVIQYVVVRSGLNTHLVLLDYLVANAGAQVQ